MNIQKLTEQDLPALAELFKQFWNETSSLSRMRASFRRLVNNPSYLLLAAKQDGMLVGFVMGLICEELYGDCQPFLLIEDLIVDKDWRRNGIGEALMNEVEQQARKNDCCQILLVTEADRKETLQFYRASGYEHEPYKGFKKRLTNS